jgi:hypothetical protein
MLLFNFLLFIQIEIETAEAMLKTAREKKVCGKAPAPNSTSFGGSPKGIDPPMKSNDTLSSSAVKEAIRYLSLQTLSSCISFYAIYLLLDCSGLLNALNPLALLS